MKPVWIKYAGLIPVTKRGYLIALAVEIAVGVVIFVLWAGAGFLPPLRSLWEPVMQGPGFRVFFVNNLYRIILLCLIAQVLDTYVVLRKFAKKEAEQREQETALAEKPSEAIMEKKTGIIDRKEL